MNCNNCLTKTSTYHLCDECADEIEKAVAWYNYGRDELEATRHCLAAATAWAAAWKLAAKYFRAAWVESSIALDHTAANFEDYVEATAAAEQWAERLATLLDMIWQTKETASYKDVVNCGVTGYSFYLTENQCEAIRAALNNDEGD